MIGARVERLEFAARPLPAATHPPLAASSAPATNPQKTRMPARCCVYMGVNGFMARMVRFDSGEMLEKRFSQFPPRFAVTIAGLPMPPLASERMPENAPMHPMSPCRA